MKDLIKTPQKPKMKNLVASATLLFIATYLCACTATQKSTIKAIQRSETQRLRALMTADTIDLAATLAEDLRFVHSNGVLENKEEFVRAVASQKYIFRDYQTDSITYSSLKNTTIAYGSARIAVLLANKEYRIKTRFTAVYTRQKRKGAWRLSSWQNTKTGEWKD
jgi:Domain of unknown function (DUF4440)